MLLPAGVSLAPLAQQPARCEELAAWLQREREREGNRGSLSQTLAKLHDEVGDGAALPATLLAIRGEHLVGSASLTRFSGPLAQPDSLWLTNVWVHPGERRQGIGRALVWAQTHAATRLAACALYLYTHDQQDFYQRLGWSRVRRTRIGARAVTIMQAPTADPPQK